MQLLLFLALFISASSFALNCTLPPGTMPRPLVPVGQADAGPIEHILVIMQENHSFDNYFGQLSRPQFYGSNVDGQSPSHGNPDDKGGVVTIFHSPTLCPSDPRHSWDALHGDWNGGKNDGFVKTSGPGTMAYYDERDLPFYYDLANTFAIGDRYFASTMTQTFPNRFYLMAATSFGHINNILPINKTQFSQPTIFDAMTAAGVSWKYYNDDTGYTALFQPMYKANKNKMAKIKDLTADLAAGTLPQVSFIDSGFEGADEHPDGNIQLGQAFVAARIQELISSSAWAHSVLFLTYDENGGFFDHVPPPLACLPDSIEPDLSAGITPGHFDQLGFRVPFVAVSPYVKRHFVSHEVYDHTSVLKFIEKKFNLPALSARDANANGFDDLFDYAHPDASPPLDFSKAKVDTSCTP